jgi:hypothetical protein
MSISIFSPIRPLIYKEEAMPEPNHPFLVSDSKEEEPKKKRE